jgi:hypothetical protein
LAFPQLPLPVAVIFPNSGILLIPLIRPPPLNPPRFAAAFIAAIGVSPVAGPANEEHDAATIAAAKKLAEWDFQDFRAHRSCAGVDNGESSCQAGCTLFVVRLACAGPAINENPDRSNDRGFPLLRSVALYSNQSFNSVQ